MAQVFVSIGSNIDRVTNVSLSVEELTRRFGVLRLSSIYESDPVGFDGDPFLNLVAGFGTSRPPSELVSEFREIEAKSGRSRGAKRMGPRTLDLDLLLYGDQVIDEDGIVVPREEIARYAFVLGPLAEVAGGFRHPVTGDTIAEMWAAFDGSRQALRRVAPSVSALRDRPVSGTGDFSGGDGGRVSG